MRQAGWSAALAIGLLWPATTLSAFDGAPLDGRLEAIVVGLAIPALWWLDRSFLLKRWPQALVAALIAVKVAGVLLPQEGLCAAFSTTAPLAGEIQTIPVDEPRGVLRSWDLRADWRAEAPRCTAIIGRSYATASEFPAWFTNVIDFLRPGRGDLAMAVSGTLSTTEAGRFTIDTGETMQIAGRIGGQAVSAERGAPVAVQLPAGHHQVDLRARLSGQAWKFEPRWNGESAWSRVRFTTGERTVSRLLGGAVGLLTTLIVVALVATWGAGAIARHTPGAPALLWVGVATTALIVSGVTGRFERLSGLLLIGAAIVPVAVPARTLRSAFLMVGVPWLAFFAARSLPLVGHVSAYSADDWLTYQVAGYRIFMHGYWLEGGSLTFDYQPLYRWLSGALHLIFGDSSVGETYADAAALLAGALLAFALVREAVGFRAAQFAAAATLATFAAGTIWYFVGRGLSETAAAGFAFLAAFALLRARTGETTAAAVAGVWATLMFYTRLNHLLFGVLLAGLLLPAALPTTPNGIRRALAAVPLRLCAVYGAVFATGVGLFAARTWWFTGVFSLLHGTSLRNNDTGLRLATIADAEPWRKVAHSLSALLWMNEPPHPDPRALLVAVGVLTAAGALCQLPRLRQLPLSLVIVVLGSCLSAFLVHTHNYPGRMSIHLVPFAVAAVVVVAGKRLPATPEPHVPGPNVAVPA
jgi:hypothetical protein